MSQFAHEHPEDPEGAWEALLEAGDLERKRRRENPLDVQGEEELSLHLREIHLGDPAYDNLHSPQAIRRQEQRDRESDEQANGYRD